MYLDALKEQDLTWPVKYDDMFPYADFANSYWTGYFTSRANLKKLIRDGSANLHASTKLTSMKVLDQSATDDEINKILSVKHEMLDAMGIN